MYRPSRALVKSLQGTGRNQLACLRDADPALAIILFPIDHVPAILSAIYSVLQSYCFQAVAVVERDCQSDP